MRYSIYQILESTDLYFLIDELDKYNIDKNLFPNDVGMDKIRYFLYSEIDKQRCYNDIHKLAGKKYFSELIGNGSSLLLVNLGWSVL